MKTKLPASARRTGHSIGCRILRGGLSIGSFLLIFSITAIAQAVGSFDAEATAPAVTDEEKKKEKPKAEPGPVNTSPSRYAGTDLEGYVASFAAIFPMGKRETDPFGKMQDPDAKPIIKPVFTKTEERVPEAITPFADIISRIEVTTIMPGEKRFLVGNRSINENDVIPLNYRGRQIKALVAEVSSQRIVFKNMESGETGVRELNLLPVGMTPGNKQIMAPGMMPLDPNAPLILDVASP
jgi:hypothetical protein